MSESTERDQPAEWDHDAAKADLIRLLTETQGLPGEVRMPRLAVNMLLDQIAELTPRTITTVEELLALPSLTVVRSAAGSIVNIVGDEAFFFGYEITAPVTTLALPITVLQEGHKKREGDG
ncbi:hypothetical protein [Paenarthrobacter nicotinovorans]|uniref:hypothetical protein n=1 Tax=Paenarthrobacter nicotinovorans TaxID=29320 RepID=UPI002484DCE7|nr:hypothetical protein [Paenarthrobacter nicotinovorans]MDI2019718.1 hypothetical protein [Paenarthrobacter nicotinovorans]